MTGNDLIKSALRKLGVIAVGEAPDADQYASGLESLNDLLDSLSIDSASVFTITDAIYSLTTGKSAYTIGKDPAGLITADFDAVRPARITEANLIVSGLRYPLALYDDALWASIRYRNFGSLPSVLYADGAFPFETLNLHPQPATSGYQLELFTWTALQQFANGSTKYYFPGGYARMLKALLAIELAPDYDREPSATLLRNAADAKAAVQNLNLDSPMLVLDPALVARPGGRTSMGWLGNYQR